MGVVHTVCNTLHKQPLDTVVCVEQPNVSSAGDHGSAHGPAQVAAGWQMH